MMRFGALLTGFIIIPLLALAQQPGPAIRQQQIRQQPPAQQQIRQQNRNTGAPALDPAALANQPSGAHYNQLKLPQFVTKICSPPNEPAYNGGIGNGGNGSYLRDQAYHQLSGPVPYYCGGNDEADSYKRLIGSSSRSGNPNEGSSNLGTYQFVCMIDRCQTEGCGGLQPDGAFFVLGVPTHAMNCHPFGWRNVWDDPNFENHSYVTNQLEEFRGRNWMGDRFRFGRYLLRKTHEDLASLPPEQNHIGPEIGLYVNTNQFPSDPTAIQGAYLDVPYSRSDLTWGFTCPEIMRVGGYNANEEMTVGPIESGPTSWHLEQQRICHYKTILTQAVDRLGSEITEEVFGHIIPPYRNRWTGRVVGRSLTTDEKKMSEVVVNAWQILKEMAGDLEGASCNAAPPSSGGSSGGGGWLQDALDAVTAAVESVAGTAEEAISPDTIDLWACPVARNTLVECKPDQERCCLKAGIAEDCQSKRAVGSHAHYNVSNCTASYGVLGPGGLVEQGYQMANGWDLFMGSSSNGTPMLDARVAAASWPSADGYSWAIIDSLAHQLIHYYFKRENGLNRMSNWPAQEASWEERLAIMGESLIHRQLCQLGYAPCHFGMEKNEFIRDVIRDHYQRGDPVRSVTQGSRFFYPAECRGWGERFIGPMCTNLLNLTKLLTSRDLDTASMMAQLIATSPLMDTPEVMTINGYEQPFAYPAVEGILERTPAQDQGQMIRRQDIQIQRRR